MCDRLMWVAAPAREMRYYPNEVKTMSFRNGDKSREHRLRKARQKKRERARQLSGKVEEAASPAHGPAKSN